MYLSKKSIKRILSDSCFYMEWDTGVDTCLGFMGHKVFWDYFLVCLFLLWAIWKNWDFLQIFSVSSFVPICIQSLFFLPDQKYTVWVLRPAYYFSIFSTERHIWFVMTSFKMVTCNERYFSRQGVFLPGVSCLHSKALMHFFSSPECERSVWKILRMWRSTVKFGSRMLSKIAGVRSRCAMFFIRK